MERLEEPSLTMAVRQRVNKVTPLLRPDLRRRGGNLIRVAPPGMSEKAWKD